MKIGKCDEKIWVEDIGDGHSDTHICGGDLYQIGDTNLAQCNHCKKVTEIPSTDKE